MALLSYETPSGARSRFPVGFRLGFVIAESVAAGWAVGVLDAANALEAHTTAAGRIAGITVTAALAADATRNVFVAMRDSRVDAQNELLENNQISPSPEAQPVQYEA